MSKLRVNELDSRTGSTIEIASGANLKSSGSVAQVKHTTYGTLTNTTSASYIDLCNIVITPKFANSSFFLFANFAWSGRGVLNLFRDSTQLHTHAGDPYVIWGYQQGAWNNNSWRGMISVSDYDSPTYTLGNSITYHVKYRSRGTDAADGAAINERTDGSTMSNFTVMEIAE
jgi:hypothetical protein